MNLTYLRQEVPIIVPRWTVLVYALCTFGQIVLWATQSCINLFAH